MEDRCFTDPSVKIIGLIMDCINSRKSLGIQLAIVRRSRIGTSIAENKIFRVIPSGCLQSEESHIRHGVSPRISSMGIMMLDPAPCICDVSLTILPCMLL